MLGPDPAAVAADERLVEDLRRGGCPIGGGQVAVALARWRDDAREVGTPIFDEMCLRRLVQAHDVVPPDGRVEDWCEDRARHELTDYDGDRVMADLLFMPSVLRAAGLPVREVPGWQARGHGAMGEVLGVLLHHTAGPASGNYPSESIVVNGRPGLEGPLANLGLARDGTWVVISNGQGWHAGTGYVSWCGRDNGNVHLIGVEAESVGTRDDWTAAQRESYPRGVAALLRFLGLGSWRALGHKEWAPDRKIDPAFWDMNSFRADVARWMASPAPQPAPAPHLQEDDEMFIRYRPDPARPAILAVLSGPIFVGLGGGFETASAEAAIAKGAVVLDVGPATWNELDKRSHAVCDNPRPVTLPAPKP